MSKKADEILAVLKTRYPDYDQMKAQRSRDCCKIIEKMLLESDFRRRLAGQYLALKDGHPNANGYPSWTYELAFCLYDPESEKSEKFKALVSGFCKAMLEEFDSDDLFITRSLSAENRIPAFLKRAACDLLNPLNPGVLS